MTTSNDIFKNTDGEENAVVGKKFERAAQRYFSKHEGLKLEESFELKVGIRAKKVHQFDLGSEQKRVLVECKRHTWGRNGNIPSGKMHAWNEAMFLLHLAPNEYRKILFVLRHYDEKRGETLAEYYVRTYQHFISDGVEIIESDREGASVRVVKQALRDCHEIISSIEQRNAG